MIIPNRLPGIVYAQLPVTASRAAGLSLPPRLVVIHDTSNDATAAQEAAYAASRPVSGATSAHFYVDGTGPLGSLPLNKQAWAAYGYANRNGWHIEMCGYNAGMKGAVPAKTIGITALLVRQLCDLAGIPIVKLTPAEVAAGQRGICGHWDITTGLNVGTHDDPGPEFDWPAFIAAVEGDDVEQTDKLIKTTDNANRVVGDVLADVANLRNFLVGKETAPLGPGAPAADSREGLLHGRVAALVRDVAEIKDRKPASVEVDVAALADALAPALEAAAERAVRKVLGAVDGATPPVE